MIIYNHTTPESQDKPAPRTGRLVLAIAAGIVLGGLGLALVPFVLIGGMAIVGLLLHLFTMLAPLLLVGAVIWGFMALRRRR